VVLGALYALFRLGEGRDVIGTQHSVTKQSTVPVSRVTPGPTP
jgi:hypothetical protein